MCQINIAKFKNMAKDAYERKEMWADIARMACCAGPNDPLWEKVFPPGDPFKKKVDYMRVMRPPPPPPPLPLRKE